MVVQSHESGVLSYQRLKQMIAQGYVSTEQPIREDQIQPSSIDLRLGKYGYRVPASFLLSNGGKVAERLAEHEQHYYKFSIEKEAFLEAKKTYVFELQESLALPSFLKGRANPKSSTGRVDTFTRLITDRCQNFDTVAPGYHGKLYLIVFPMSFDLKVKEGLCLNQLRFTTTDRKFRLTNDELHDLHRQTPLLFDYQGNPLSSSSFIFEDGIFFSLDLSGETIGFRSKKNAKPIDLTKIAGHPADEYWEPIKKPTSGKLILDPDFFYILRSKERVAIPTAFACEMVDFHSGIGEFRSHYAGFFDPGFGFGKKGEIKGTPAVLEVRMRDMPMEVEDGQLFVKMVFERMLEIPEIAYGVEKPSHYQSQGLKLAKYFV